MIDLWFILTFITTCLITFVMGYAIASGKWIKRLHMLDRSWQERYGRVYKDLWTEKTKGR